MKLKVLIYIPTVKGAVSSEHCGSVVSYTDSKGALVMLSD